MPDSVYRASDEACQVTAGGGEGVCVYIPATQCGGGHEACQPGKKTSTYFYNTVAH